MCGIIGYKGYRNANNANLVIGHVRWAKIENFNNMGQLYDNSKEVVLKEELINEYPKYN